MNTSPLHFVRNLLATVSIAALLAGCEVGPDYQRPEMGLPGSWISGGTQAAPDGQQAPSAAEQIDQVWWQNFNDPVLNQLIAHAAAGNLDVQIAEARIAEARATQSTAAAGLLPTGDFKATANREANQFAFPGNLPGLTSPFNSYQTGFDASWELDLFGGHKRDLESASAGVEASIASRDEVLVSMLAEVARTYVDIRQYQSQLAVAEATIASDANSADIARQRFEAGQSPRVDLTQAEAQLDQAKTQLPYYRNLLAQAEFSLDVLLGEQPGAAHTLVQQPMPIPLTDKGVVLAAPAVVIANRPDIRNAERQLAAATAMQGVAVAKFFPDISLNGFIGLLSTDIGQLPTAGAKSWLAGGSLVWPILSYGSLSANLDAANAKQQEAMLSYKKSMISALSDVEKSVTAYTEQENYRVGLERTVNDNKHTIEIARERYKEGLTSFLEVLDAQRTLYTSQSQLIQSVAQTSQNMIAVYKSLGGGWAQSPVVQAPRP
jgi:NodT family efflux transporter outer membrane factor (OMF) lipoprotein